MELSMRAPLIGSQFEIPCSRWFVLRNSVAGRQHEAAIQLGGRVPLIRRQLLILSSRIRNLVQNLAESALIFDDEFPDKIVRSLTSHHGNAIEISGRASSAPFNN
jgi:hypothetical protein